MSGKLNKFELNRAGVRELLRSEEVRQMLEAEAEGRVASLGDGYTTNTLAGRNRINVRIVAESKAAQKENLNDNTLLQSIS